MKLISMTDFVLEQTRKMEDKEIAYLKIYNYAKFLKQPLQLEMFLPIGLDGLILLEHNTKVGDEAQRKKVLFEIPKWNNNKVEDSLCIGYLLIAVYKPKHGVYKLSKYRKKETIEDLIGFVDLTLTETAKHQIGL